MQRLILHHFYRAGIRKAWVHTLSTRGGEKNDAKLTAVCISRGAAHGEPHKHACPFSVLVRPLQLGVEKPAREASRRRSFLTRFVRPRDSPCDRGLPPVQQTGGFSPTPTPTSLWI